MSIPLSTMFVEYMRQPTAGGFARLRQLVLADPRYEPYSGADKDLEALVLEGRFAEVRPAFDAMMPGWLLSPKAHTLASFAAMKLGDARGAQMEQFIASRCLQAILQTGDGSDESPYVVTQIADEYDILQDHGRRSVAQSLYTVDDRHLDVHRLDNGVTACFDVTDLQLALRRRLGGAPAGGTLPAAARRGGASGRGGGGAPGGHGGCHSCSERAPPVNRRPRPPRCPPGPGAARAEGPARRAPGSVADHDAAGVALRAAVGPDLGLAGGRSARLAAHAALEVGLHLGRRLARRGAIGRDGGGDLRRAARRALDVARGRARRGARRAVGRALAERPALRATVGVAARLAGRRRAHVGLDQALGLARQGEGDVGGEVALGRAGDPGLEGAARRHLKPVAVRLAGDAGQRLAVGRQGVARDEREAERETNENAFHDRLTPFVCSECAGAAPAGRRHTGQSERGGGAAPARTNGGSAAKAGAGRADVGGQRNGSRFDRTSTAGGAARRGEGPVGGGGERRVRFLIVQR